MVEWFLIANMINTVTVQNLLLSLCCPREKILYTELSFAKQSWEAALNFGHVSK